MSDVTKSLPLTPGQLAYLDAARIASKFQAFQVACELYERVLVQPDGLDDLREQYSADKVRAVLEAIKIYGSSKISAIKEARNRLPALYLVEAKDLYEEIWSRVCPVDDSPTLEEQIVK